MAFINKSAKEIQVKIVYYGPGRCGKTTNLLYINQKMNAAFMGKMISIDTRGDKTLFFDFLPLSLGKIRGFNIRVQLYTVPGQVLYNESRKMVLKGVDGVVFVADSMEVQQQANAESLQNLRENLADDNLDLDEIPLVLQFNKRDLEGSVIPVLDEATLDHDLNSLLKSPAPSIMASALQGPGVFETLREVSKITIKSVHHKLRAQRSWAREFMAKQPEIDDLDELIDRAVDTFFVEAPSLEERPAEEAPKQNSAGAVPQESAPRQRPPDPSFEEVMDQLFMDSPVGPSSSDQRPTTVISSGDPDIDRAIDLAVETLFVEEPETPPPETAQLQMPETNEADELFGQTPDIEASARKRMEALEPELAEIHRGEATESEQEFSYDDAMAMAIARHMNSMYGEAQASRQAEPSQEAQRSVAMPAVRRQLSSQDALALRRLQEAILTLEWEISRRSVAVLASELQKVRVRFQDNIAVDFAAMSMRIVLEYVAKRMSRAHPESVRFLLEVTDFLERLLASGEEDPLRAFHQIVQRYETYKSVVRQAEGLPNRKPEIAGKLEIRDPEAFASLVDAYAVTLSRAGQSLANRIKNSGDPENLIRSFRFLVTRSMNRVLEKTLKEGAKTRPDHERS